jgi:MFS family permease
VTGRPGWVPVAGALVIGGWGANQFTPLSVVYRTEAGWATLPVIVMFTVYLLGLVPALLLGCRAADRFGRRRVVTAAVLLEVVGSIALAGAVESHAIVYLSRLVTGVGTGVLVSAGGAWLQDLSGDVSPRQGSRRAVYAIGAGFALGPLAAGAMAEWLPYSMVVPCLVHAVGALAALVWLTTVPRSTSVSRALRHAAPGVRRTALTHPRLIGIVLPASPAIFAAVTVAYVVLPPLVLDEIHGYAPLFSGLVAALTLAVGLLVQPLATWLDRAGTSRATLTAMATVVVGLLLGALAVDRVSPVLVLVAAVVLGAGYGLTLEAGLAEIGRITPPLALPTVSALFQGVAHSGFLAPLLLAITAGSATYPELLAGLALVGCVLLVAAAIWGRLHVDAQDTPPRALAPGTERGSGPWAE